MVPTYLPGRLVFIERDPTARNEVCLVNVGGELRIKRVVYTPEGRVRLISDNPAYPPEEVSPDDAKVLGRVVDLKER